VHDLSGEVKKFSGQVQNNLREGAHLPVLPQPLFQKSFYNLQNSFFPQNFLATQTVKKNQENSGNLRQMCHRPYEKSSIITLPEILGKLSRVPSMKVSAHPGA
jgi:hypothetical protein